MLYVDFQYGLSTLRFQRCDWALRWNPVAGLYAFIAQPGNRVVYIGETEDYSTRMPRHDKWWEAVGHGATDVYTLRYDGADWARKEIEKALISHYNPPCNTQHRSELNSIVDALGLRSTPSYPQLSALPSEPNPFTNALSALRRIR